MMKVHYFFSMRRSIWLLTGLIFFGCSGGDATDDEETIVLQELEFNYHQGMNTLYFGVNVESSYLGIKLQGVSALYYGLDSTQSADTLALNDSGINGDIISDDDVFAIKITNDTSQVRYVLEPSDTGTVYVKFMAQFGTYIKSKMMSQKTGNEGPIIQSVSMPDSMPRPGADSVAVGTIVVSLTDADGHEDIQTCYLMFKKPDGTFSSGSPISLYDNGVQDFSMYLWDETAKDGKYSRYIIIDSSNPLGTYTSYFYARDYSGILSEPFITELVVY